MFSFTIDFIAIQRREEKSKTYQLRRGGKGAGAGTIDFLVLRILSAHQTNFTEGATANDGKGFEIVTRQLLLGRLFWLLGSRDRFVLHQLRLFLDFRGLARRLLLIGRWSGHIVCCIHT
jgi:hypothetical protein